jgi:hypothetical protein
MPTPTLPLEPDYTYKVHRQRRILLAIAEDGTPTGRFKGPIRWSFELVFRNRTVDEYESLRTFWETQGYHIPFTYTDPILGVTVTCRFDSEISMSGSSFNTLDFDCTITEF